VIIFATIVVFMLAHVGGGDPAAAIAGENATPEQIAELRRAYGFDRPLPVQYFEWLGRALRGDMSLSIQSREPVLDAVTRAFPHTLVIVVGALALSLLIGLPLGIAAATRAHSRIDTFVTNLASLGIAVPSFWLAMILISLFSLHFHWFPATGAVPISDNFWASLRHATLPAVALAASGVAEIARQVRSALIEVLSSQYVRTLHAKGLPSGLILWKHGLKNISVTLLTVTGLTFNRLLGATVVIETMFAIPGIGALIVRATLGRDFTIVQGVVLFMVAIVIATNLVIDIVYTLLDPRVSR
jgi:peptide/nickel transport system permease protein